MKISAGQRGSEKGKEGHLSDQTLKTDAKSLMPPGVCSPIPEGLLGCINKSALDPEGNEISLKSSDRDQGHEKNGCLERSLWPQWEPGLEGVKIKLWTRSELPQ